MEVLTIKEDCLVKCNVDCEVAHIVSKGIKKIGKYAFSDCKELERLYLPWYVEEVPETNFVDRTQGVFRVTLQAPNFTIYGEKGTEAERVARQASVPFEECTEIVKDNRYYYYLGKGKKVAIPENVEYIFMGAFKNAPHVTEITFPQNLKLIGTMAFAGTSIEKIIIPKGVKSFGSEVFKRCKNLTEVIFENGETKLDNNCFLECSDLLIVKAPAGGYVEEYAKEYGLKFQAI